MKKIFFLISLFSTLVFAQEKKLNLYFTSFKQNSNITLKALCQDVQNQFKNQYQVHCQEINSVLYSEQRPYLKNISNTESVLEVLEHNSDRDQIELNILNNKNYVTKSKTLSNTNIATDIFHLINSPTQDLKKLLFQGHTILLDTHDIPVCLEVVQKLEKLNFKKAEKSESLKSLCQSNSPESDRFKTIYTLTPTTETYKTQFSHKFLTNTESNILNETRNLSFGMIFAMIGFAALPTSITKWEKTDKSHYSENVKQKPVVDKDEFLINYVGHPVSGAAYYMISRNLGYSKWESFGYSFMMSTFFWEYGFEALAERPSIQDLISTPVLGAILGEYFYNWSKDLENNHSKLLGSKKLGKLALILMNPAGELSQSINRFLNRPFIQKSQSQFVLKRQYKDSQKPSNYIGVQLDFKW